MRRLLDAVRSSFLSLMETGNGDPWGGASGSTWSSTSTDWSGKAQAWRGRRKGRKKLTIDLSGFFRLSHSINLHTYYRTNTLMCCFNFELIRQINVGFLRNYLHQNNNWSWSFELAVISNFQRPHQTCKKNVRGHKNWGILGARNFIRLNEQNGTVPYVPIYLSMVSRITRPMTFFLIHQVKKVMKDNLCLIHN